MTTDLLSLGLLAGAARDRLDRLERELDGIRAGEGDEPVHQARVAARRLRTILDAAEDLLPPGCVRPWRRRLKRLLRRLGAARDLDVQRAALDEVLAGEAVGDGRRRRGVERVRLRVAQARADEQPRVLEAVDEFLASATVGGMRAWTSEAIRRAGDPRSDADPTPRRRRAAGAILPALDGLLGLEDRALDPADVAGLHAMRLAAKRLRYALEAFAPAFDGALDRDVRRMRRLQTVLGDVHDHDVWDAWLVEFREAERERAIRFHGREKGMRPVEKGVAWLRREHRAARERRYEDFRHRWSRLRRKERLEQLAARVAAPSATGSPERPRPVDPPLISIERSPMQLGRPAAPPDAGPGA